MVVIYLQYRVSPLKKFGLGDMKKLKTVEEF